MGNSNNTEDSEKMDIDETKIYTNSPRSVTLIQQTTSSDLIISRSDNQSAFLTEKEQQTAKPKVSNQSLNSNEAAFVSNIICSQF